MESNTNGIWCVFGINIIVLMLLWWSHRKKQALFQTTKQHKRNKIERKVWMCNAKSDWDVGMETTTKQVAGRRVDGDITHVIWSNMFPAG